MIARAVALLSGGIVALASIAPAFADESVRLMLVYEQVLESDEFYGEPTALFLPCGNAGFLYVQREEGLEPTWYLYRVAYGTSTDTGWRYGDELPDACSADGNWVTAIKPGGSDSRIVSLRPDADASLSISNGFVTWSSDADARAFLWFNASEEDGPKVSFHGNLTEVELFAGQIEPGFLTSLPAWTVDGKILLGWSEGEDTAVLILPDQPFRFDENVSIDSLPSIGTVIESSEASLLQLFEGAASHLMTFQTSDELIFIHEYALPYYLTRYLCTASDGWQCDTVPTRPTADLGGQAIEMLSLLDSTGRLFWIENRGGEFCAAVATAGSRHGNCEHEGPLSMFEEIWGHGALPDGRYAFVVGRKSYDDEMVLAVFELAVVSSE